jgi:hypothetical protein
VGKGLELLAGGRLRATPHRVLAAGAPRRSLSFFYCPHPAADVAPLRPRLAGAVAALEASVAAATARWATTMQTEQVCAPPPPLRPWPVLRVARVTGVAAHRACCALQAKAGANFGQLVAPGRCIAAIHHPVRCSVLAGGGPGAKTS